MSVIAFFVLASPALAADAGAAATGAAASASASAPAPAAPAPVTVAIAGARGPDGITVRTQSAALDWKLRIDGTTASVTDATVHISPLVDDRGTLHEVTLPEQGKATVPVSAAAPVLVPVTATLPAIGTYTGEIALSVGGKAQTTKFSIIRELPSTAVEVLPIGAAAAIANAFCGRSTARVLVPLHEMLGKDTALADPTLIALTLKGHTEGPIQAPYGLAAKWQDEAQRKGPLILASSTTRTLELSISELDSVGEYAGTVRLAEPGAAPLDRQFTFYVKDPRWVAIAFILLGVVSSALVRRYVGRTRPKLATLSRCLFLEDQFEGFATLVQGSREQTLLSGVQGDLRTLHRQVEWGAPTDAEVNPKLDAFAEKLQLFNAWVSAFRRVSSLEPAELRPEFFPAIDEGERRLLDEAELVATLAPATAKLKELPGKIDTKVLETLNARLEKLSAEMNAEDAASPLAAALKHAVGPEIAEAKAHLQRGQLSEALTSYDMARRRRLDVLLDELGTRLAGPAPYLVDEEVWKAIRVPVANLVAEARRLEATDLDAAFDEYSRSQSIVLRTSIAALKDAIRAALETPGPSQLPNAVAARQTKLRESEATANAAEQSRQTRELSTASARYDDAAELFREATDISTTRSGLESVSEAVRGYVILNVVRTISSPDSAALSDPKRLTSLDLVRGRLWLSDAAVAGVAFVSAAILGDLALWENSLTWGGWSGRLLALIWGLGLHQFSFQGLAGLNERLTGQKDIK